MREKIARTIDPALWALYDHGQNGNFNFGRVREAERLNSLDKADAVLDALMEPDEGMIEAYHREEDRQSMRGVRAEDAWQAMLTAARSGDRGR